MNISHTRVGESGMGRYHGKYSFDTFTHHKAMMVRPTWLGDVPVRYPPYSNWKQVFLGIMQMPLWSLMCDRVMQNLDARNILIALMACYIGVKAAKSRL
jgi:hypothetical protein